MWRIIFQYSDGGKIKVSNKGHITLEQAEKYYKQYGIYSDGGFYQESPYKTYEPEHLTKVIARLRKEEAMKTPSKEKAVCKTCQHMEPEAVKCGRNIFYCMHPEARTECLPHRIISRSRENEIPTKTAPKWCPLNQKEG